MSTLPSVEGSSGQHVDVSGPGCSVSLSLFDLMKGVCSYTSKWDICFSSGLSCCQGRAIKDVNFVPKNSAVISSATASVSNQVTNVCLQTFAMGYLQSELGAS